MDLNQFAQEVHENAVKHGWWESERSKAEVLALIHSEWSEALEEYRARRPMVWYDDERNHKPEGIATELMDGIIRILDYYGHTGITLPNPDTELQQRDKAKPMEASSITGETPLPEMVCYLHQMTSKAMEDTTALTGAIGAAMRWVAENGFDPAAILREKHEYNKTRPYKHGKVC